MPEQSWFAPMGYYTRTQYVERRSYFLTRQGVGLVDALRIANDECDEYYEYIERVRYERKEISERKVFEYYGNICSCCGEKDKIVLVIDHIDGGGTQHRKEENIANMYTWLITNNFPEGFRILCSNCNSSYGYYKYCPHRDEEPEWNKRQLYRRKRRKKAITLYGDKCIRCGENIFEFLCFHHSGGWELYHKKRISGSQLVSWLLKQEQTVVGIELLCYNCHVRLHYSHTRYYLNEKEAEEKT